MDEGDKLDQIGRAMMQAWGRVKKAQSRMWGDWMIIGDGLLEGRRWAMQKAGTNKPEGKGYVLAFNEWLHRYKVDDMHKADRSKLLQLMEERPGVEDWRMSLPDYERRSLNNPTIVWRRYTAVTRVKKPKPRSAGVSATEHGRAQRIIDELQSRVIELEQERDSYKDRVEQLERELAAVQPAAPKRAKVSKPQKPAGAAALDAIIPGLGSGMGPLEIAAAEKEAALLRKPKA